MSRNQAKQKSQPPLRLEWLDPAQLEEHPENWKTHPESQVAGLESVIGSVGWAGALLFNEKTGRLLDGHARKKLDPKILVNGKVPVLVGSWDEDGERLILATLDPLGSMARANQESLQALLGKLSVESEGLQELLDSLSGETHSEVTPPEEFPSVDEDLPTDYQCPKCGYEWSGPPK